jgi:hypothetical protein
MTSKYSFLYQAADGSLMRPEKFLNINKGRTLSSSQLRALRITKVKNESFKRQATSSKQRGLTKREERLGWITRGHEPQAASDKPQATSDKLPHVQTKKKYRY